jgi:hypothetical protein
VTIPVSEYIPIPDEKTLGTVVSHLVAHSGEEIEVFERVISEVSETTEPFIFLFPQ